MRLTTTCCCRRTRSISTRQNREALQKVMNAEPLALIEYWAVDPDYDGEVFRSVWQDYRGNTENDDDPLRVVTTAVLELPTKDGPRRSACERSMCSALSPRSSSTEWRSPDEPAETLPSRDRPRRTGRSADSVDLVAGEPCELIEPGHADHGRAAALLVRAGLLRHPLPQLPRGPARSDPARHLRPRGAQAPDAARPVRGRGPGGAARRAVRSARSPATVTSTRSTPPRWRRAPARHGCSTRCWSGSTSTRSPTPTDERFTSNFLLVAPGLIVYDRLLDSFLGKERGRRAGLRRPATSTPSATCSSPRITATPIFGFLQSSVVTKTDIGRKVTGGGMIAITNWHLLAGQEDPTSFDETRNDVDAPGERHRPPRQRSRASSH